MCGRICTPAFCNALGSWIGFTVADVYSACECGPKYRRREPDGFPRISSSLGWFKDSLWRNFQRAVRQ